MNVKITCCRTDLIVTYYMNGKCLFSYRSSKEQLTELAAYILKQVPARLLGDADAA